MKRVKTEIKGFDRLIEGGFPDGSITLVSGTPGTGKSIFCMQFLVNCAKKEEKSLYISFEETETALRETAKRFSWPVEKLEKEGKLKLVYAKLREDDKAIDKILQIIREGKYQRLVIDSLSDISVYPLFINNKELPWAQIQQSINPIALETDYAIRMKIQEVIDKIRETGVTALVTSELSRDSQWYSRDTVSEFACDAVIILHAVEGEEGFRTLWIPKMRKTKQRAGVYSFEIEKNGINVKSEE